MGTIVIIRHRGDQSVAPTQSWSQEWYIRPPCLVVYTLDLSKSLCVPIPLCVWSILVSLSCSCGNVCGMGTARNLLPGVPLSTTFSPAGHVQWCNWIVGPQDSGSLGTVLCGVS